MPEEIWDRETGACINRPSVLFDSYEPEVSFTNEKLLMLLFDEVDEELLKLMD